MTTYLGLIATLPAYVRPYQGHFDGWMAERLKAAVSKTVVGDSTTYREFESPSTLRY